ncbi:hypothetical protein [uncultured Hymenobacter sp.]|uniref:hypothetical protein n=1 Tax=uncultured Hymenobacter sp. TaxID=170016 RepID=UPI0035C9B120
MQFHQRQLTRSTTLSLRTHGLHVAQRDGQGRLKLEAEMLYEELLPVQLDKPRAGARREIFGLVFALGYFAVYAASYLTGHPAAPTDLTAWAYGTGLVLAGFGLYGLQNWWRPVVLRTPRLHVVLAHRRHDRRELQAFVAALEAHTKAHLRQRYARVNPLGSIEPQLRRLAWLRDLGVLNSAEARALTTRLTGQLPQATLRGMGQELEGLFVN